MPLNKQNGGKHGVALTTQEINGAIGEMICRHVVQLSEHLSSIQIIGTKLEEDGTTSHFAFGSGDLYARAKASESWLARLAHGQGQ